MVKLAQEMEDNLESHLKEMKGMMMAHMNDDHHVIITRLDKVEEVIDDLKEKINPRYVGYAGLITAIATLLSVLLNT